MFRVMVTGSRDWAHPDIVRRALQDATAGHTDIMLVSGACPTGADAQAEEYACEKGWSVERHPADWKEHGRKAGPLRNQAMIDSNPDILLAFLKDNSRGTQGTIRMGKKANKFPIRVFIDDGESRIAREWNPTAPNNAETLF